MFIKRAGAFFLDILEVIVFAVAIFLFIYLLILQPHKIKGASMEPNFPNGEYILTDKVTYRFNEPQRGDIIVFQAPAQNGDEFIKRIIALPGELIMIKEGKIFINSKQLAEDYLSDNIKTSAGSFLKEALEVKIPPGSFIVLGDNRSFSSDSRAWGFVPRENITGRGWIIYWPPPSIGIIPSTSYNGIQENYGF